MIRAQQSYVNPQSLTDPLAALPRVCSTEHQFLVNCGGNKKLQEQEKLGKHQVKHSQTGSAMNCHWPQKSHSSTDQEAQFVLSCPPSWGRCSVGGTVPEKNKPWKLMKIVLTFKEKADFW